MSSATVPDQYATICAILDPPYFLLDTTFKFQISLVALALPFKYYLETGGQRCLKF
jgi:hypothetical protein